MVPRNSDALDLIGSKGLPGAACSACNLSSRLRIGRQAESCPHSPPRAVVARDSYRVFSAFCARSPICNVAFNCASVRARTITEGNSTRGINRPLGTENNENAPAVGPTKEAAGYAFTPQGVSAGVAWDAGRRYPRVAGPTPSAGVGVVAEDAL